MKTAIMTYANMCGCRKEMGIRTPLPNEKSQSCIGFIRNTGMDHPGTCKSQKLPGQHGCHFVIFTFPQWVFKWTYTFETSFIPSWTDLLKPRPHTRHLNGPTSTPSNSVVCLLTFAWHWTRITMTLSAETWHFGYSETSVMSDLIQNNQTTSQIRWTLKNNTWMKI